VKLPLVTVGIASFNNATYLRETLESIRLQTYPQVEIIIVDDASSDDSVVVARKWLSEYPEINARLICHETNLGVCRVCNDIVTQSKGEFISIIGSDDVHLSDKLAKQVPLLMEASPQVGVIFGDIAYMDSTGSNIKAPNDAVSMHSGDIFIPLLIKNFVPAMSTLVRRKCYDVVGIYDESLSYEDMDMWLRIARQFEFLYVPGITARYRIHSSSASFSRQIQLLESSLRLIQKHRDHSPAANRLITDSTSQLSAAIYRLDGGGTARQWLWQSWQQAPSASGFGLLALATLRIPASKVRILKNWKQELFGLRNLFKAREEPKNHL
jgi:glycosyltransferase involved in cell wall biosynthesis